MTSTDSLVGPRENLLESLVILGGRAPIPTIAESASGDVGTPYYYLEQLVQSGCVERAGSERVDSGEMANVYAITDAGRHALSEQSDRGDALTTTDELETRIEKLESQVTYLTGELDELTDDAGW